MSSRLSKFRSVHTYVMLQTVYFGWICTVCHWCQKLGSWWKFEPNWLKMAKIAVLSYRCETEKKCQFWKQLCDRCKKLGSWWNFEPNHLKNGQNSILSYRRETEKKMSILKTAMWSVSKVRKHWWKYFRYSKSVKKQSSMGGEAQWLE